MGADFGEEKLNVKGRKFKDASVFYNNAEGIDLNDPACCLKKPGEIQLGYKNIVKRKGKPERLIIG